MEIKAQILNAAVKLFADKGFDGVSIRDVANEAGVHFSNIRHHFGDKDGLYKACISTHGESRLIVAKRYLLDSPKSVDEARLRLTFALSEVFENHSIDPNLSKLLLREVETDTDRSDKVLKSTMLAQTKIYKEYFEKCMNQNFLETTVDANFLTTALMGVIHHYMRTEGIRSRLHAAPNFKNKEYRDEVINKMLILFFDIHLKRPK